MPVCVCVCVCVWLLSWLECIGAYFAYLSFRKLPADYRESYQLVLSGIACEGEITEKTSAAFPLGRPKIHYTYKVRHAADRITTCRGKIELTQIEWDQVNEGDKIVVLHRQWEDWTAGKTIVEGVPYKFSRYRVVPPLRTL